MNRDDLPLAEQNQQEVERDWWQTDFVGMWADREDMADSSEWVHELRQREWA
jgi:hypothetical protein